MTSVPPENEALEAIFKLLNSIFDILIEIWLASQ